MARDAAQIEERERQRIIERERDMETETRTETDGAGFSCRVICKALAVPSCPGVIAGKPHRLKILSR